MAQLKAIDPDRFAAVVAQMQRDGWAFAATVDGSSDMIFVKTLVVRGSEFPRCVHCKHVIHKSARIWTTLPGDGYTTLCDANPGGHADA